MLREALPRYDELEDASVAAVPFPPRRVLELGIGTGETTRRLLARFPEAQLTGLDADPAMIFAAREMPIQARLARMEDPLPDGPWDLVIGVLAIHHLDSDQKRDLFRRVREQSRSLVIGDLVDVPAERRVTPIEPGFDMPSPAALQAEWCGGEVAWETDDIAVIRAVYD